MKDRLTYEDIPKRRRMEALRQALADERISWEGPWRAIADYVVPWRAVFNTTNTNRADNLYGRIIDNTAPICARTLSSGMQGGITDPSRQWFKVSTPDPDRAAYWEAKLWLEDTEQRMRDQLLRTNFYNITPELYTDLSSFGTCPVAAMEDTEDVLNFRVFPCGSYYLDADEKGEINTFVQEFSYTIMQLVREYGLENVSQTVRNLWDRGNYTARVDVVHTITPNPEYNPKRIDSRFKEFSSCHFEKGANDKDFLRESGFDEFPVITPRWETRGRDVYGGGRCPGWMALPDSQGVQVLHRRLGQAIDKIVNPPLIAPTALSTTKISQIPGDVTFYDAREGQAGLTPLYKLDFRTQETLLAIKEHDSRIEAAYFKPLFLMMSSSDRRQMTAEEVRTREAERVMVLSPVLERLDTEFLSPVITRLFTTMYRQGKLQPPPQVLQGEQLKIEYTSILAQAAKMQAITANERLVSYVGMIAPFKPDIVDALDLEHSVADVGEALGVSAKIIRSPKDLAAIRQGRAKQQQAMQQAEAVKQAAGAAKDLAAADTSGDNALTNIINGPGAAGAA